MFGAFNSLIHCFEMFWDIYPKASSGPYAWQHRPLKRKRSDVNNKAKPNLESGGQEHLPVAGDNQCDHRFGGLCLSDSTLWKDQYLQYDDLRNLPRSMDVFRKIEQDPVLTLNLAKPGMTAGRILAHAVSFFDKLWSQNHPMTFKFGVTHDAAVRWRNTTFGYKYSKDKFDYMAIIYGTSNPHGPSFLEAALIDRFGSNLFAFHLMFNVLVCF